MYRDPKMDMPVTQFNMKWVEPAGLVNSTSSGLKTLTVLDVAVKLVTARHRCRSRSAADRGCRTVGVMLARGEVVGVFQVESQGMRRALIEMRPDRFEDIIALVAPTGRGRWRTSRPIARASMARRNRNIRCWSRS
ncbi:MAG: hypothetical protein R3D69_11520 [Xanthobacteraceae bacterium]